MREVHAIIDDAILENRLGEYLLYALSTILVGAGAFSLVWAVVHNQGVPALAGAVSSSLFVPAMMAARNMRKENLALRVLEVPLSNATTAEEAARVLQTAFLKVFADTPGPSEAGPRREEQK